MLGLFNKKKHSFNFSCIGADMHGHWLSGLDDGAQSIDDSILIIQSLQQLGYKKLIATPHIISDYYPNTPQNIRLKLNEIKKVAAQHQLTIQLEIAAEYMVDFEFEQMLQNNQPLLSFANNFVLIEMSYLAASENIQNVLLLLNSKGYTPILAHPERYKYCNHSIQYFQQLKSLGCLLQLNLLSLTGYYGSYEKKFATALLQQNMIDFLGTDVHHAQHLNALQSITTNKNCYQLLQNYSFKNSLLL